MEKNLSRAMMGKARSWTELEMQWMKEWNLHRSSDDDAADC